MAEMADSKPHDVLAEAIAWRLRLADRDADWDGFVAWLDADPARSDAYDQVEAADAAMLAATFPAPRAVNDDASESRVSRRYWILGLAAAAATAVIVAVPMVSSRTDRYDVVTAAGQQRRVAIADGSYAMLNGSTHLILDHHDPRFAELVSGEATFSVRHDSGAPFIVRAGEHQVRDVGTAFNMILDRGDFTVEVIEGAVVYNPEGAAIALDAGKALHASAGARPLVTNADPRAIAGWRRGQLNYVAAPLARVASDMSRTLGVPIAVDEEAARVPLTGSIRIQSDVAATVRDLALVADVVARREDDGWILEPLARAPR